MLPLSLLSTATGQAMLIELKNGDTYNGKLVGADTWMNVNLEDVICTSRDGDRFWKLPQCYIRGNSIKYLRIPDEIIDMVAEEEESRKKHQPGKPTRHLQNAAYRTVRKMKGDIAGYTKQDQMTLPAAVRVRASTAAAFDAMSDESRAELEQKFSTFDEQTKALDDKKAKKESHDGFWDAQLTAQPSLKPMLDAAVLAYSYNFDEIYHDKGRMQKL